MQNWVSPLLGIRFEVTATGELQLYTPTGEPFAPYVEAIAKIQQMQQRLTLEQQQRQQLEQERAAEAQASRAAIPNLLAMGLTVEQVAQALQLSVAEVNQQSPTD